MWCLHAITAVDTITFLKKSIVALQMFCSTVVHCKYIELITYLWFAKVHLYQSERENKSEILFDLCRCSKHIYVGKLCIHSKRPRFRICFCSNINEPSGENMIFGINVVPCSNPIHWINLQRCKTGNLIGQFTWNFDILMKRILLTCTSHYIFVVHSFHMSCGAHLFPLNN